MLRDSDLLRVQATGEFSLEEAKRTFLETMEGVALHGTKRVLIDGRTITGNPETIERFYYGEFAAQTVARYEERGVSPATATSDGLPRSRPIAPQINGALKSTGLWLGRTPRRLDVLPAALRSLPEPPHCRPPRKG